MTINSTVEQILKKYLINKKRYEHFLERVNIDFTHSEAPIHSIKSRLKNEDHLRKKLLRKITEEINHGTQNEQTILENFERDFFAKITDLAGIRILHIHRQDFYKIHSFIDSLILKGEWSIIENPIVYLWDKEWEEDLKNYSRTFEDRPHHQYKFNIKRKSSYYTSVHYLVSPGNLDTNKPVCEIQVRTLFEEIWGEIDHSINYPIETTNETGKSTIKVLAHLISTGTKLSEVIYSIIQKETQTAETQTAETQTAETQTAETQTAETQTAETQTAETQTAET